MVDAPVARANPGEGGLKGRVGQGCYVAGEAMGELADGSGDAAEGTGDP